MGDLVGRVDVKFGLTIDRIKDKLRDIGVENVSDRVASKIASEILDEVDFSFRRVVKKRKDRIEIRL